MDWNNICRTCLTTNTTLESIDSSPDPLALEYEYSASYSNMIKSVTSLSIVPNDTLPQHICQKCINSLLIAFNFQKLTIKTEEALQSLRIPEIKILQDPLSITTEKENSCFELLTCMDLDMEEVNEEISPNKSDLKCDKMQNQVESRIKVKDPILTHDVEIPKQRIDSINTVKNDYKTIYKKFDIKSKTVETPKKQLFLKKIIKKTKTQQHEIKIKSAQALQNSPNMTTVQLNNNLGAKQVFLPCVAPPPLVFLSESKTTPPPLFLLPVKPVENCKYCEMKFVTEFDLKIHLLTHEIDLNCVNKCHFCWETPKDLLRHLKEHYKYLTCAQCNIKFDTITKFENHMSKNEHLNLPTKNKKCRNVIKIRKYLCRICGIKSEENENICRFCKNQDKCLCRFCGKEFLDFNLFVQHERRKH